MAQRTKDQVKQWFETGDYPTQVQFYDFFDSILWKGEAAIGDIQGLAAALAAKLSVTVFNNYEQGEKVHFDSDGYYDIPGTYLLEKVIIVPGEDAEIAIGNTDGGDELLFPQPMSAVNGEVVVLNLYAKAAVRRIYFSGLPAGSYIIFLKRKIKS